MYMGLGCFPSGPSLSFGVSPLVYLSRALSLLIGRNSTSHLSSSSFSLSGARTGARPRLPFLPAMEHPDVDVAIIGAGKSCRSR